MLYLFNSAFRPKYLVNVLNTLYLPTGLSNEYRYNIQRNVNPDELEALRTLSPGEHACITFIDRYAENEYRYYPMRLGLFRSTYESGGYIHFGIELREFIYPRSVDQFNTTLVRELADCGIPTLNQDPENLSDGFYALRADSVYSSHDEFLYDDEAWTACVRNISSCHSFVKDKSKAYVFMRGYISQQDTTNPLSPITRAGKSFFKLLPSSSYQLNLTYYFHLQSVDQTATANVAGVTGESIRLVGPKTHQIGTLTNSDSLRFETKRYIEEVSDALSLEYSTTLASTEVLGPDAHLPLKFGTSIWHKVSIAVALILYSVLAVIVDVDVSKVTEPGGVLYLASMWPNALGGLLQALVVYWIFRLVGKELL